MKPESCKDCPIAKVASLLSDPWTMLIFRDLNRGRMRFSELHTSLSGISTRTLTLKLKHLEETGVVTKDDPWYTVTPSGKKIQPILDEMEKYGKKYL